MSENRDSENQSPKPHVKRDAVEPSTELDSVQASADSDMYETAAAPSLPGENFGSTRIMMSGDHRNSLGPGDRIAGFEVVAELGRGASGEVYLARETTLDRRVALKVTANRGHEGKSMAHLQHESIVQVYSETVEPNSDTRLLCMQYVPGCTLQDVVEILATSNLDELTGEHLVAAINTRRSGKTLWDDEGIAVRELLSRSTYPEAVCWIGARLAEALAHAHHKGVLHRDIKAANVLMDPSGRPLLADFSLASRTAESGITQDDIFGGTLAYMSPEHLEAFNPNSKTPIESVDERSDIYSLGIVLFQLLTLSLPYDTPSQKKATALALTEMTNLRRTKQLSLRESNSQIPGTLERIILRCLDPDPQMRFQTAKELAAALDDCRELEVIRRQLPPLSQLESFFLKHFLFFALSISFLPHVLGTIASCIYAFMRLFPLLDQAEHNSFHVHAIVISLIVYPVILAIVWRMIGRIDHVQTELRTGRFVEPNVIEATRRDVANLPWIVLAIDCIGWWVVILVSGTFLHVAFGDTFWSRFSDFSIALIACWMLSTTYNLLSVIYFALRLGYPDLWGSVLNLSETKSRELSHFRIWIRWLTFAAAFLPLVFLMMLIMLGPDQFHDAGYPMFRTFAMSLIAAAMFGVYFPQALSRLLIDVLETWLRPRSDLESGNRSKTSKKFQSSV